MSLKKVWVWVWTTFRAMTVITVMSKILDDMKTAAQNMKTFAGNVKGHKTVGSPANHNVSPDDITKFGLDEQNFNTDAQNFGSDKSDLGKVMEAGE